MYIAPDSNVRVLSGVPLDESYNHTILFTSTASQQSYMAGRTVKSFQKCTYVRQNNAIRVECVADDLFGCNYVMFQNTAFGSKWFYAFIKSIDYINNNCTEIVFTIDWIQSYITQLKIDACFVEREHVADDSVGIHTVEENIEYGEYIIYDSVEFTSDPAVACYVAYENYPPSVVDGVYTGLATYAGLGDAGNISDVITTLGESPEKIAMLTMCSSKMVTGGGLTSFEEPVQVNRVIGEFEFRGRSYTPKNNKCYCYPYCLLTVDNYNGNSENYKWEDWNGYGDCTVAYFKIVGSVNPRPDMECYPINYKGKGTGQNYGVEYSNFPMCPYVIDTFRAWASQAVPRAVVSTGTQIISGILAGGTAGAAVGLLSSTASTALDFRAHKIHSSSLGGSIGSSGLNFSQGRIGFRVNMYYIKPEYAQIIDEYFTRFGYKVDRYKVPEINSRLSFNYVKTVEAHVSGNAPSDAISALENALNHGITLWHTSDVGNFTLNNKAGVNSNVKI